MGSSSSPSLVLCSNSRRCPCDIFSPLLKSRQLSMPMSSLISGRGLNSHAVMASRPQYVNRFARRPAVVARAAAAVLEGPALETVTFNRQDQKHAVMLQAFGWESCKKGSWYKTVASKVKDIQGYMPGQLYNLNTLYGSKDDLVNLIHTLKDAGLFPVADIVINHRCADEMVDGVWNKFHDDVDHQGKRIDWGKWAITSNDPTFAGQGNPDTGDDYGPAPDLDHANPELRAALKDWLNYLRTEIGFAGWRFDFVKGYASRFVKEYVEGTGCGEAVNVGEYWVDLKWEGKELGGNQDEARQKLCDWIDGCGATSFAFDFPTKGILQDACKCSQYWRLKDSKGKAPGLLGWWPARAITFIDNHDTGSTQKHWPFQSDMVPAGYAYILTHPGVPCLFWEHVFDWGPDVRKAISTLMQVRKRNDIVSDSKLEILCAEADMYVAKINKRVLLKLGSRYDMGKHLPPKAEGWTLAASGKDYAVWERPDA